MSDNKPILDYQDTRPTAVQKRRRWFLVAGLLGGSVAAAGVRYWLAPAKPIPVAAPNPPVLLGGIVALPPTTQTAPTSPDWQKLLTDGPQPPAPPVPEPTNDH